jgi:hypothetical protein
MRQVATYNEAAIAQAAAGAPLQVQADSHAARDKSRRQILDHFDRDNFKDDAHQEQMLSSVRSLDDDKTSAAKKRRRKSTLDWKLCKSFAYVASSIPTMPILLPGSLVPPIYTPQLNCLSVCSMHVHVTRLPHQVPVIPQSLLTCASPPSNFPPRKLCAVCGYIAPYTDASAPPIYSLVTCSVVTQSFLGLM